jgi:flagellar biosynthetic protein FliQ
MPEALVVGIVRQAIETAILVSLPMLLAGLVAGVLVSVFQTVTSIQDNVLAFIPRAAGDVEEPVSLLLRLIPLGHGAG